MAYENTKVIQTLRFPGDTENQYQINAIALNGVAGQAILERLDNIESFDALRYKGIVNAQSTTPGALTPAANKGDVYKVIGNGYVLGAKVDNGDMLICNEDNTSAATGSTYVTIAGKWDIIQGNIEMDAILDHKHSGNVTLTSSAKDISHTITPDKFALSNLSVGGTIGITGTHKHTADGSTTLTPEGSIVKESITPSGSVKLATVTSNNGTTDITLKPAGELSNDTTTVTDVTGVDSIISSHNASSETAGGHTPTGSVTVNPYTPEGSVESHKHNVSVSSDTSEVLNKPTYTLANNEDPLSGILTFGKVDAVTSVSASETAIQPTFTGTSKAPTAEFKGNAVEGHTHNIDVEDHDKLVPSLNIERKGHTHTFTGTDQHIRATFSGTAAEHTHTFTGTQKTHEVTVNVEDFTGNLSGSLSNGSITAKDGTTELLKGITIGNHSISTVDSATVTTGAGTEI